jgi:hypothetical protein
MSNGGEKNDFSVTENWWNLQNHKMREKHPGPEL